MQKLRKKGLAACASMGLLCAVLMTALLCLPLAGAVMRGALQMEAAQLFAVLIAGITVLAATNLAARLRRRQAIPIGGIIAGGYIVLSALLCAGGGRGASFGPWLWRLCLSVLAGGLLGAVMSIRRKTRAKRSLHGI